MAEEARQGIHVPVVWTGTEDVPIVFVNQVLGQVGVQDEVIVSFGQITPPPLLGDPEQQLEQAEEIAFVSVKPVARVALTQAGLDDLIRVLQTTRDNFQKVQNTKAKLTEEGGET